jgi:hypothetical protein
MKQAIGNKGLQVVHRDGGERPQVARRNDGYPVSHHQTKEVVVERTRCAVFFLWLFPQGCRNLSGRQAAEQRTTTGPTSEYIKARARPVQHFARTRREIQNSKAKRPFLERPAQRLPREPLVLSHYLCGRPGDTFGRQSGRRFTSAMMTASKKVCHVVQFRILFLLPFLSLATGTGKGDTPKGILLCEGSGP